MLKILLINPYLTHKTNERKYPMEPLGLLSLATYLNSRIKKNILEFEIQILDAQLEGAEKCIKTKRGYRSGLSDAEIENKLKKYNPDIIGITNNYTGHTRDVLDFSKIAKKVCPKIKLILGGAHATIAHEEIIKEKDIDVIVRGEGEETFKEIVLSLKNKTNLKDILSITYKEKNKIKINPKRPLIEDINTLPIPDRSLIPYKKYLEKTSINYFFTMNKPVGTLFTSRGCPFRCIFCSTSKVWTNKWRGRSAENIIEEIEYLKRIYKVKEISFMDDQFMGNKKRIKKLCRLIIKKKLGVSFICPPGISPSLVDEEALNLMKQAGFYRICFSIDVGTNLARDYVGKPVKLEEMRELIKNANSKGFWTYAHFVIGFLHEKTSDIQETIKYAYGLKLDFARFFIAQPYLGSRLYDIYLEKGLINKNDVEDHNSIYEPVIGTEHISCEKLKTLRDSAEYGYSKFHIKHFMNPFYMIKEFLPKISSFKKFNYFVGLISHYGDKK